MTNQENILHPQVMCCQYARLSLRGAHQADLAGMLGLSCSNFILLFGAVIF